MKNSKKSSIREISKKELSCVSGGLIPQIIAAAAMLLIPITIGKDRNQNDNDPNHH